MSAPTWATNALHNSTINRFMVLDFLLEEEPREIQRETFVSSEARKERFSCR